MPDVYAVYLRTDPEDFESSKAGEIYLLPYGEKPETPDILLAKVCFEPCDKCKGTHFYRKAEGGCEVSGPCWFCHCAIHLE